MPGLEGDARAKWHFRLVASRVQLFRSAPHPHSRATQARTRIFGPDLLLMRMPAGSLKNMVVFRVLGWIILAWID